jgi:hypothetical protein
MITVTLCGVRCRCHTSVVNLNELFGVEVRCLFRVKLGTGGATVLAPVFPDHVGCFTLDDGATYDIAALIAPAAHTTANTHNAGASPAAAVKRVEATPKAPAANGAPSVTPEASTRKREAPAGGLEKQQPARPSPPAEKKEQPLPPQPQRQSKQPPQPVTPKPSVVGAQDDDDDSDDDVPVSQRLSTQLSPAKAGPLSAVSTPPKQVPASKSHSSPPQAPLTAAAAPEVAKAPPAKVAPTKVPATRSVYAIAPVTHSSSDDDDDVPAAKPSRATTTTTAVKQASPPSAPAKAQAKLASPRASATKEIPADDGMPAPSPRPSAPAPTGPKKIPNTRVASSSEDDDDDVPMAAVVAKKIMPSPSPRVAEKAPVKAPAAKQPAKSTLVKMSVGARVADDDDSDDDAPIRPSSTPPKPAAVSSRARASTAASGANGKGSPQASPYSAKQAEAAGSITNGDAAAARRSPVSGSVSPAQKAAPPPNVGTKAPAGGSSGVKARAGSGSAPAVTPAIRARTSIVPVAESDSDSD